jgi:DNA repair protein RecN (Recombination protein N)
VLVELRIRDLAIIDALTLPFAPGFNVLSGETGAGKSIIVGALSLLTGERASTDVIRTGADRAVVEGVFDLSGREDLRARVDARGIDCEDGLLVLKREVTAGRTRAWANGSPVTTGVLAELGRVLVNIHGQHEAQTLLDPDAQRGILDAFAGAEADASTVREAHAALSALQREQADRERRRREAGARADWLRHVVSELAAAQLREGEETELDEEHHRLQHATELRTGSADAAALLDGDEDALLTRLGAVDRLLAGLERLDPALGRLREQVDAAYYQLQELARALADYAEQAADDPERLAEVEARRALLLRLTRKYGGSEAAALAQLADAQAELALVDDVAGSEAALSQALSAAERTLRTAAEALSARRRDAAQRLGSAVEARLPSLGLADGRFTVALRPLEGIGPDGAESVEFTVALNVGHAPRPLARVASGGELARVMLALKTILARLDRVPTLVFDEVDAGIGGAVALRVGDTMRDLAAHHQVFAITHLAQLAARAHHHIVVAKGARGGVTTADVAVTEGAERVAEVARMLGGDPDSSLSRAHAEELMAAAVAPATDGADAAATSPRASRTRSPRAGRSAP